MNGKILAQQLREDALTILGKMQHEAEPIAERMREAALLLEAYYDRAPEPPSFPD